MIQSLIDWISSIVVPWGLAGVFVGSVLEEVVAPIPSLITQTMYGFLLYGSTPLTALTLLKFSLTVPVFATLGVVIGSLPYFLLSKFASDIIFKKFGKYLGLGPNPKERVEEYWKNTTFDEKFLILGRFIPFVPSVVMAIVPGLARVKTKSFIIASFIGVYIRALILGFIGWQLGFGYKIYADKINKTEGIWLPIVLVIILAIVFIRIRIKRSKSLKKN